MSVAGRVSDAAQHHVHCALHLGVHVVAVGVDERRGPGQQLSLHVCQLRRAGAQRAGLVHLGLTRQEADGPDYAVLAGCCHVINVGHTIGAGASLLCHVNRFYRLFALKVSYDHGAVMRCAYDSGLQACGMTSMGHAKAHARGMLTGVCLPGYAYLCGAERPSAQR